MIIGCLSLKTFKGFVTNKQLANLHNFSAEVESPTERTVPKANTPRETWRKALFLDFAFCHMKAENKPNRQWMYCIRGLGLGGKHQKATGEFFADVMHCWHSNSLAYDLLGSQALYTQFNEGCFGNRSMAIDLFSVYASFS